jgi:serine/threonine-protein kinase RsbW
MNDAELQLRLPAKPENVALVRQALSGIGDVMHVEPTLLADMKTAVTEACNNVVLHAYPDGGDGTLQVDADPDQERVVIVVRDFGNGMLPRPADPDEASPGLGLPLIAALSDRFEISGGGDRGIEVRMVFMLDEDGEAAARINGSTSSAEAPDPPTDRSNLAAGVAITPGPFMAPVLGRLTAMMAARADFSLDRLSDAVLVTDAIAANVSPCIPGRVAEVAFQDGDHKIDLRVGPLVAGGAEKLLRAMELPGLEHSIEDLAEEVSVVRSDDGPDGGEYLLVVLSSES